nr:protein mnn4 [Quercus suber]
MVRSSKFIVQTCVTAIVLYCFVSAFHKGSATVVAPSISLKSDADTGKTGASLNPKLRNEHVNQSDNKYFHESKIDSHYDGRFAERPLPYQERHTELRTLIKTYLSCMNDIGVETFIMHGALLGWWWNQKIMPWDSDVDVVVTEAANRHMAMNYNMTVHHYKLPGLESGRDYLLEVNPHYNDSSLDPSNQIDARWIDTHTGLFIDITTIRRDKSAEARAHDGMLMIKDNHHYAYDDIFPLRDSILEDCPVKVPFAYPEILIEEYGEEALSQTYFNQHRFDDEMKLWVPGRSSSKPRSHPRA